MSLSLSYERGHTPSLQGFIQSVLLDKGYIRRDLEGAQRDEVRVMTVHGSKGLQAPIVFLPDTVSKPKPPSGIFWTDDDFPIWPPLAEYVAGAAADARNEVLRKQEEEYRRLLYVALTRAEDRLYVCGWKTKQEPESDSWYNLVKNAFTSYFLSIC